MESAGEVGSWNVPSWTVSGVAARAYAPGLAGWFVVFGNTNASIQEVC